MPTKHGHVFEVEINGVLYALKIVCFLPTIVSQKLIEEQFKFWQVEEALLILGPKGRDRVPEDILTYHSDPFFAECRVYGRIKEHQGMLQKEAKTIQREAKDIPGKTKTAKKGKGFASSRGPKANKRQDIENLAVPCHGYLALPAAKYEDIISNKFGITDWNRSERDQNRRTVRKEPLRALVKELVKSEQKVSNPEKMLKDLRQLRELGIYQRDVRAENYKEGLLVDFSIAWTEPHWELSFWKGTQLKVRKNNELFEFNEMMKTEGIETRAI
ncbi:MAG: hypothetical protein M1821_003865 [Bathelium mastoideum]|nr:MAG: hypothetical protein M1821_003865 [Bathelium mastoideum]